MTFPDIRRRVAIANRLGEPNPSDAHFHIFHSGKTEFIRHTQTRQESAARCPLKHNIKSTTTTTTVSKEPSSSVSLPLIHICTLRMARATEQPAAAIRRVRIAQDENHTKVCSSVERRCPISVFGTPPPLDEFALL